ncbi:hypothetical protein H6P81_017492 [Aristolochia fimbriata]|uniref:Uncharacterized protein n=1 Tax=Aristolochia fimbriata TaxID=158543 RepID=A0AAV7DYM1_ARIFI|nr:hypothetical protein H6P81_017492 [Aristolochia fimbriata]
MMKSTYCVSRVLLLLLSLIFLLLSLTPPGQSKSVKGGECQVFAPDQIPNCSSNCAEFCRGVYREKLIKPLCIEHDSLCSCFIHCSAPPSPVAINN